MPIIKNIFERERERERERGSMSEKPHAVCIPYPTQSHIKAMLKLAKLLHSKGIHITFVNTEFNHKRFLKSGGPNSLDGLPDFRFETIPDGLPPSDCDATQDLSTLNPSIKKSCLSPFLDLLERLKFGASSHINPPVTAIISDGFMTFTIDAAEKHGIPVILFWTLAACGFMGFYQFHVLLEKGLTPLKEESLTNGFLDTVIDWIPGMKGIRFKDLPSFARTTDPTDVHFNTCMEAAQRCTKASGNILHTFPELESDLLNALSSMFTQVFTIGPLQLHVDRISDQDHKSIGYSLWKEEPLCLQWLASKKRNSVVYVNFGSIATMSNEQLVEFGWGLANSNQNFLWIIRPDMIQGESAILPPEFLEVIKQRGLIVSWCNQEHVLNHSSIGVFLTHGGWNSTIESLSAGVPMICLPFFGDQQTNCRYMYADWGVGIEMDVNSKRNDVEKLVRELMEGEKGEKMKSKALEWKKIAEKATGANGSSSMSLDRLVNNFFFN